MSGVSGGTPLAALRRAAAAALPLLLLAAAAAAGDGVVQGTVIAGGAGQSGVAIEIYLERKKSVGGTPFAMTESLDGGRFAVELPEGTYYFWARSKAPAFGPPKVTEYPGNPVAVAGGKTVTLSPLELKEVGREGAAPVPKQTGLKGRVVADAGPAADASVMIYDGGAAKLTGPGYVASIVTGPDGTFQADLAPGKYRVAARKRLDGGAAGFLRPGDLSAEYPGNPVTVARGAYTDLGDLRLHGLDPRRLAQREKERREGVSPTRLKGVVSSPEGAPLAAQHVFIYRDQAMIGRPDLMAVSGPDGTFAFDLPAGGTWYLGARSTMGGPRQPGEMAGRLAGSPDSSVTVAAGATRDGLVIKMEVMW